MGVAFVIPRNMPTTKSGARVKKKLEARYGKKKGDATYYALQAEGKGGKGKHKWEIKKSKRNVRGGRKYS